MPAIDVTVGGLAARGWGGREVCLAARLVVVLAMICGPARAEEIAPFRLTGIEGHASLRYVSDTATTGQSEIGAPALRQSQSGFRNELFVMSHSYVYHPNLLTLDIGGGPILHGEEAAAASGETSARGMLYNLVGRASFLRDKPYRGGLFFEHLNPTVAISPGQVMAQENTRYGADFSLLAPVTPVPLQLGFIRSQTRGRGADRLLDDRMDQFTLGASRSFAALGSSQLQYQASQQSSMSGSRELPIQSSSASNQSINLDTRLQFGADRQVDFTNMLAFTTQKYAIDTQALPALRDTRLVLDLRARHSPRLHTHGAYSFGHSAQGDIDSTVQTTFAGLSYWPTTGVEATLGMRDDSSKTRQIIAHGQGIDGMARYERDLPLGTAQISYGARNDRRAQQALAAQATVLGERLTLSGSTSTILGHPRVIAETPVVSNATRSQIFVAGIDYLLTVVGIETRLQRLIGGRILDGETLLVDYAYDVGGTYAYDQVDQTLNLNWNLSRYINAYYRRFAAAPRLVSGVPTFPLNEVRSSAHGLRVDLPFKAGLQITAGGGIEREERRETIAPYRRRADDLYIQTEEALYGLANFRAATRRSHIEYAIATQNSDLRGHELRFWSRPGFGLDITGALSAERDDAGLVPRRRRDGVLGLQWQERKFTLTTSLVRTKESQAGIERDRTTFQFLAKRDF